jgi:23S rRNA (guanosine2251-2'-O)-methyltransferase
MNKKLATTELQRPTLEEFEAQEKLPVVVVLDNIRSLANVGSIFRTSDGFSVQQVILGGITGKPPHREIQRTALGATESVPWIHVSDVESELNEWSTKGYSIVSVEQCEESISPSEIGAIKKPICLVLGNEVEGVSQNIINMSDAVIEIPQSGTKHSFNVTVAAGIVLWECFKAFKD